MKKKKDKFPCWIHKALFDYGDRYRDKWVVIEIEKHLKDYFDYLQSNGKKAE